MLTTVWKNFRYSKMILVFCLMTMSIGFMQISDSMYKNTCCGVLAAIFVLCMCISVSNNRLNPIMISRRMSGVFKLIFYIYVALLIVLLFNNSSDSLSIINTFFPSYATEQPPKFIEKTKSCEFKPAELLRDIDEYFLCHLLGWFVLTLLMRDPKVVFLLGLFDEVYEVLFRDLVPLFGECWFDQIFYDLLITNLSGIALGWYIINKFNLKKNDLFGGDIFILRLESQRKLSLWQRIKNLDFFDSSKRIYYVTLIISLRGAQLVTSFIMFDVLWIPIVSIATVIRLLIWGFAFSEVIYETQEQLDSDKMLLSAKRSSNWEEYFRIKQEQTKRPNESEFKIICFLALVCETLICLKFWGNQNNTSENPRIKTWKIIVLLCIYIPLTIRMISLFYKDYVMTKIPTKFKSRKTITV